MRRNITLALAAFALVAAVPSSAAAKSPPKGTYTCTYYNASFGTQYAGTLRIVSGKHYTVNKGKKGRYTTQGKKIRWRSGDYKGAWAFAKWRRSGGTVVIGLYAEADDDSESTTCTRS